MFKQPAEKLISWVTIDEWIVINLSHVKMDEEKEYPAQNSTFSDDFTKFE